MIVKKPYAFLIKNFKVIHLILFVLSLFLYIKTYNVFSFFNTFYNSNYAATLDYSKISFSALIYVLIIIILLLSFSILFLFKYKNKPLKSYKYNMLLYSLLLIFYIYITFIVNDMQYSSLSFEKVRIIRDICLLAFLPQTYTLIFTLVRGLGFNLKSFDFSKDISNLDLKEEDAEEIQLEFSDSFHKYKKFFNKILRNIKYFYLENKLFINILCSLSALILSIFLIITLRETTGVRILNNIYTSEINYKVKSSYVTNLDSLGEEINNKTFIIVSIDIKNISSNDMYLDEETFYLSDENDIFKPTYIYRKEFIDIGNIFKPFTIESGNKKSVILVYEVKELSNNYILNIKNNNSYTKSRLVLKEYDINNESVYSLSDSITFSSVYFDNVTVRINNYSIDNTFNEYYEICNKECNEYIYPVSYNNGYVLKIDSDIVTEDDSYISTLLDNNYNLFKYFAYIEYRYKGNSYKINCNILNTNSYISNSTYIAVPKEIYNADKIELVLTNRNNRYRIVLK